MPLFGMDKFGNLYEENSSPPHVIFVFEVLFANSMLDFDSFTIQES